LVDDSFVLVAGDTMTGALALPANPTAALEAAPKQYVDSRGEPAASMYGNYAATALGNATTTFPAPISKGDDGVTVSGTDIVLNRTGFYFIVHNGDMAVTTANPPTPVPYGKRGLVGIQHNGAWVACGSLIWNERQASSEVLIWGVPGDVIQLAMWQNQGTGYNAQALGQTFSIRFLGVNL
jgi:hypothetical protein